MIDFEIPEKIAGTRTLVETVTINMMHPFLRYFDEHEIPWDYITFMHTATKAMGGASMAAQALGLARGTLELLKKMLAERGVTIRYGLPHQKLTSIEKDVIAMEIQLRSA